MIYERVYNLQVRLPETSYLESSARLRKMSRKMLMERVLEIILRDQLILSILDDSDELIRPARKTCVGKIGT